MRWLSRIPLWGWFVFTVLLCYAIYNPTEVSLLHMVVYSDVSLPLKLLTSAAVIALLGLYVAQTYRSFNTFGLACLLALVGRSDCKARGSTAMSQASPQCRILTQPFTITADVVTIKGETRIMGMEHLDDLEKLLVAKRVQVLAYYRANLDDLDDPIKQFVRTNSDGRLQQIDQVLLWIRELRAASPKTATFAETSSILANTLNG
jgi:hypothetical protein